MYPSCPFSCKCTPKKRFLLEDLFKNIALALVSYYSLLIYPSTCSLKRSNTLTAYAMVSLLLVLTKNTHYALEIQYSNWPRIILRIWINRIRFHLLQWTLKRKENITSNWIWSLCRHGKLHWTYQGYRFLHKVIQDYSSHRLSQARRWSSAWCRSCSGRNF